MEDLEKNNLNVSGIQVHDLDIGNSKPIYVQVIFLSAKEKSTTAYRCKRVCPTCGMGIRGVVGEGCLYCSLDCKVCVSPSLPAPEPCCAPLYT